MEQLPQYKRQWNRGKYFGKYANMYGFWFDNRGVPLISLGPQWPMFFCLSIFLSMIGYGFTFILAPQLHPYFAWAGFFITTFCVGSYMKTALSNPGILLPLYDEAESAKVGHYCKVCDIIQKPSTQHCDDCGLCIEDYDHHCPWTSKCIGKGNIFWFNCFLFGLCCMIIYSCVCFAWGIKTYKLLAPKKKNRIRGAN